MKLLTLNVWGGKIYEPLIKFIKQAAVDTDIFVFKSYFSEISPTMMSMEQELISAMN